MALFGFTSFVLFKGGEFTDVNDVIKQQMTSPHQVIYGLAYSDRNFYYKYQSVLARAPQILAVGKSRILQIRSNFFKNPSTFYNAGGGIVGLEDIRYVLQSLPSDKRPKFMIVALDQFFFNSNWEGETEFSIKNNFNAFDIVSNEAITVLHDYRKHKFSLHDLISSPSGEVFIGINAKANHNGFRKDGSSFYAKDIRDKLEHPLDPNNTDFQFKGTLGRIYKGTDPFQHGMAFSTKELAELNRLLAYCKQHDIYVVAFLPPYAHFIYKQLISRPDQYGYLNGLASKISPVFDKYGYSFYDFSDIASLGSSDLETLDGFHASEKAYLRLFLVMLKSDEHLREVAADEGYLKKRLATAPDPYTVFGNEEN